MKNYAKGYQIVERTVFNNELWIDVAYDRDCKWV